MDDDRLLCGCGWAVWRGLDCDFCGTPAHRLIAEAEVISAVPVLRAV